MNIDANTSASIVIDEESFLKAVTTEENGGTWIAALLKDMKFNHPVTVEGEFENRGQTDRKIGLYSTKTLEDGTKIFTHNFTLTIPKLFIKTVQALECLMEHSMEIFMFLQITLN